MPLDLTPQRKFSERAHAQRTVTRVLSVVAGIFLALSLAGAKGLIPKELTGSFLGLMIACVVGAVWSGLKGHRQALADREKESGGAMLIAMAVQLGRQDDETLAQIQSKGGPAAEAARMILTERQARARRTGQ